MARSAGSKEKLRRFLLANKNEIVTARQLQVASGGASEWARRVRELRQEEGWPVMSDKDRADLKPGEYRLEGDPPARGTYVFAGSISSKLRAQVLERNGYTCQMCGVAAADIDESTGRAVRLHIGHIVDKDHGGRAELGNLRALCSTCNQGAKNIAQEPPGWTWLLSQIRRASVDDQRKALDWLRKKLEGA